MPSMNETPKPDYWRYVLLGVIVLLGIGNGVQHWRYQQLEANHRALTINGKAWVKTIKQLGGALERSKAKQNREPEDATQDSVAD